MVWLSQGEVSIAGTVSLDGEGEIFYSTAPKRAEPGPGGFRGGIGSFNGTYLDQSSGFGPAGGGWTACNGAVFGGYRSGQGGGYESQGGAGWPYVFDGYENTVTYGDPSIRQLIGGSGGSAGYSYSFGINLLSAGAGGGAILLASDGEITISGVIRAQGGNDGDDGGNPVRFASGAGAGGAIRLVASQVTVTPAGALRAQGGTAYVSGGYQGGFGSSGRIRVEAPDFPNNVSIGAPSYPPESTGEAPLGLVWPPQSVMSVAIASIGGEAPTSLADPAGALAPGEGSADVTLPAPGDVTADIVAQNVPLDWVVRVRVTPARGYFSEHDCPPLVGSVASSATSVTIAGLSNGYSAIQAWAEAP